VKAERDRTHGCDPADGSPKGNPGVDARAHVGGEAQADKARRGGPKAQRRRRALKEEPSRRRARGKDGVPCNQPPMETPRGPARRRVKVVEGAAKANEPQPEGAAHSTPLPNSGAWSVLERRANSRRATRCSHLDSRSGATSLHCEVFGECENMAYLVQLLYERGKNRNVCRRSGSRLIISDDVSP
jgi:uncharacterized iron-regulated membrane protein